MKSQTAFIVVFVLLLVAILYFTIYLPANKNKTLMAANTPTITPTPQVKRQVTQVAYNPFPQDYLNSFGNPELIRAIATGKVKCRKGFHWDPNAPGGGACIGDLNPKD